MLEVKKHGVILAKTDLGFENAGVLNPAVIRDGATAHLFYRAVRKGNYSTIGYCRLNGPLDVEERFDTPVLSRRLTMSRRGLKTRAFQKLTAYIT